MSIKPKSAGGKTATPTPIPSSLAPLSVQVAALCPYPGNPRRGDLEAIKDSLLRNGQYRPIVVRRETMEVLAGNHTLLAARELGWSKILATLIDVDEQQAKRILLADNRTSDLAGYDERLLAELLEELGDLAGTGYEQVDLDALLEELSQDEPLPDDEPPPLPTEPRSRPGDRYRLGRHLLVCADARAPASYERLLGRERAQLLWTDPPYGVSYVGKTARRLRLANDRPAELAFLVSRIAAQQAASPERVGIARLRLGPRRQRWNLLVRSGKLRSTKLEDELIECGAVVAGPLELGELFEQLDERLLVVGGEVVRAVVGEQDPLCLGLIDVDEGRGDSIPAELDGSFERVVSGEHLAAAVHDDRAVLPVFAKALLDRLNVTAAWVSGVRAKLRDRDGKLFERRMQASVRLAGAMASITHVARSATGSAWL